jgi:hypothetical protein
MTYYLLKDQLLMWIYNNSIFVLIWMHFVMDFVCQTHNMALGKSKSNKWLLIHIAVYSTPFLFFGVPFALINGLTHLVIDYFTSRFNSKMWKKGTDGDPFGFRLFWIGIGFDQALHATILMWLAKHLLLAF